MELDDPAHFGDSAVQGVQFELRPHKLWIVDLPVRPYTAIKLGTQVLFLGLLILVIIGAKFSLVSVSPPRVSGPSDASKTLAPDTCYGRVCSARSAPQSYALRSATWAASDEFLSGIRPAVARHKSNTRCEIRCSPSSPFYDRCKYMDVVVNNRESVEAANTYRAVKLARKINDAWEVHVTGYDGSYTPSTAPEPLPVATRGPLLFLEWEASAVQAWEASVTAWDQQEANALEGLEVACHIYRASRLNILLIFTASVSAAGGLWLVVRLVQHLLDERLVAKRLANLDSRTRIIVMSNPIADFLRRHTMICMTITAAHALSTGWFFEADTFAWKTTFYIIQKASLWGLAYVCVTIPNHPAKSEPKSWIDHTAALVAAVQFILCTVVWFQYAEMIWGKPLGFASGTFNHSHHLDWHGWLQATRYSAGGVFLLLVYCRQREQHDDKESKSVDYSLNREWVVARAAYWKLCLTTLMMVGISAVVTEVANNSGPWFTFDYWFQRGDLVGEGVGTVLLSMFGWSMALLYYPRREAQRKIQLKDIRHSSFSRHNTVANITETQDIRDIKDKLDPKCSARCTCHHMSSVECRFRVSMSSDETTQLPEAAQFEAATRVTATFNKTQGSVVLVLYTAEQWNIESFIVLATPPNGKSFAISDFTAATTQIMYSISNGKLDHGPAYRFRFGCRLRSHPGRLFFSAESKVLVEGKVMARNTLTDAVKGTLDMLVVDEPLVVPEQKMFDPITARVLARLSNIAYDCDALTSREIKMLQTNTMTHQQRDSTNTIKMKTIFERRDRLTRANRAPGLELHMEVHSATSDGHVVLFKQKRGRRTLERVLKEVQLDAKKTAAYQLLESFEADERSGKHAQVFAGSEVLSLKELGASLLAIHENKGDAWLESFKAAVGTRSRRFRDMIEAAISDMDPHCITQLILAFRGTASVQNAKTDVESAHVPYPSELLEEWETKHGKVYVHRGFYDMVCDLWYEDLGTESELQREFYRLVTQTKERWNRPPQLTITGHSLGGALATLVSLEIALSPKFIGMPLQCYTFGQPRVTNPSGAKLVARMIPHYWRVVNNGDPVPKVPKNLAGGWEGSCLVPRLYACGRRYKHASDHAHGGGGVQIWLTETGQLVPNPGPLENELAGFLGVNPSAHSMDLYEHVLELFLKHRRQWLWRKAIHVVRSVVRLTMLASRHRIARTGQKSSDDFGLVPTMGNSQENQHDIHLVLGGEESNLSRREECLKM